MTNRATKRANRRHHQKKRTQTKQSARELISTGVVVPPPPEPSWAMWWDPRTKQWFAHDQRIIDFIKNLATKPSTEDSSSSAD